MLNSPSSVALVETLRGLDFDYRGSKKRHASNQANVPLGLPL